MVTKEQAMTLQEVHYGTCTRTYGPRGGVTITQFKYRRNGMTKTWKRNPNCFRVPLKFGYGGYDSLDETSAHMFHDSRECPLLDPKSEYQRSSTCTLQIQKP